MRAARKPRSVNRRYNDEVYPVKDDDSTKRGNSRKRKLSDMLGPRWTKEELSCFYDAYRKYGKDFKEVANAVRNRSPEMVEALCTMNRAYLSLPHGTASAAGLIAMMTDHYCNVAGSDSDQERDDRIESSRKTLKHPHGKVQPTTSKVPDDQFVSHFQVTAPDYGCPSLLKKKRSGGSRPCPVGKRTPRFPVSFSYENLNGDKYLSPTRRGLKLKANANDDVVAQEIAVALAEASQKGGTSKVSGTPSKLAESVVASPFRYAHRKHSPAEMGSTQNLEATIDEELEGSTEADTGELSKYKPYVTEVLSVGTFGAKPSQLESKNYEVGNNSESRLDDIKELCSGTEEGKMFGAMRGNIDVDVMNSKIAKSPGQNQRKKSTKVLFERDDASAFEALQTLADLSLMMQTADGDDSRAHLKNNHDNPVDELVSAEALPVNQKKEKCRYSGVRMEGHKPITSSEVALCKRLKPGKAPVISSVPEENQDPQLTIAKTPRRRQKIRVPKILNTEAHPDIHQSGTPGVEDGDPMKKLLDKTKKSSQTGSPHLLSTSENSSSADLLKEASDSAQSCVQPPVINQVNLTTKVRSKRKTKIKKTQIHEDLGLLSNILNDCNDPPIASHHSRILHSKENLPICLSNPRLRRWCIYEWFCSAVDYPWFAKREFVEYLYHVGLGNVPRLTRVEWGVIRSSLGKPRRFSKQFLKEEKEKLNKYRDSVRKHYSKLREGILGGLPTDLARPLSVGQRVTAIHPKTREIHDGSVLTVDHSRCRVQFDRHELGVEFVMDIDCMPLNPRENLPAALFWKEPSDNFFENANELKVIGQEQKCTKLCPSDRVDITDDTYQLSPSANPANLFKQTKVSCGSTNHQRRIVSTETGDYQQTAHSLPSILAQIQAKEADVQALAELTRALEKKEAVVLELRHMNDDVSINKIDGDSSLKDTEPFRKQYAAVLVQLNEANEQVSSALYCLRQRNTYQGNIRLAWSGPRTNFADLRGEFSFNHSASRDSESVLHVNEIIDSSKTKARAMVDAAMQAMSSLKGRGDTTGRIEDAIDYVNGWLPFDECSVPEATNPEVTSTSEIESQIPLELISKCIATLLMIKRCTQRQCPPSDVARILDSAVTSLQPHSSQNLPVYTEIEKCMGIIRNQIIGLIPT